MALTVKLHLPAEVERTIVAGTTNIDAEVQEAYVVQLFREGRLTHYELSQALGLDRFATDAYLQRHHIFEGSLTMEDLREQDRIVEQVMERSKSK